MNKRLSIAFVFVLCASAAMWFDVGIWDVRAASCEAPGAVAQGHLRTVDPGKCTNPTACGPVTKLCVSGACEYCGGLGSSNDFTQCIDGSESDGPCVEQNTGCGYCTIGGTCRNGTCTGGVQTGVTCYVRKCN